MAELKFAKVCLILVGYALAAAQSATAEVAPQLPTRQNGGAWPSGHVQGIAVDLRHGYIYYSFTNLLAKYDFKGNLVGTLVGWTGHLGDLDFNPEDGKVYGSLEYKADQAFYIAMIDVSRLDRIGIDAGESEIFQTVHLAEVARDYAADMNGDGKFDGNVADTPDHRYGCSGIDGVAFGPAFGRVDGKHYLTVAYGVYHTERTDNDHQILLQYDVTDWARLARPLTEAAPHRSGPAGVQGKYFVRTGNTRYGVQNLAYDEAQQRWFMGVYQGQKPGFPNYLLFAVDAGEQPVMADLVGVPASEGGWEKGYALRLADDGLRDPTTGIRGWHQKADVGFQPVGGGLFYIAENGSRDGLQTADLTLMRWTDDPHEPFRKQ